MSASGRKGDIRCGPIVHEIDPFLDRLKLMMARRCAANDSIFVLPSSSVSPNAYSAPLTENKARASANVIHPRSSGDNADKEWARVASVVPSSFVASGGVGVPAPNSFPIRLISPIQL